MADTGIPRRPIAQRNLVSRMSQTRPIVIAHRGASGYLPEHSIGAKVLAHGYGADYLEQDVILTRDDVPIVFHDLNLEELTDVARRFPGRARIDGHWYAIDFTLAELKSLQLHERVDPTSGQPHYPGRFAERGVPFSLVTLDEDLDLVHGLNRATGRMAGVYTEVKSPAWHRAQGKDSTRAVLDTLARHGYMGRDHAVYLQCFDDAELRRMRDELRCDLKLIQLIGENEWQEAATDYDALRTAAGLAGVARYAQGIGPPIGRIVSWPPGGGAPALTTLVADAHALGLAVHPYTLRIDDLPPGPGDATALHAALFDLAVIDGLFTDFPDRTKAYIDGSARAGGRP